MNRVSRGTDTKLELENPSNATICTRRRRIAKFSTLKRCFCVWTEFSFHQSSHQFSHLFTKHMQTLVSWVERKQLLPRKILLHNGVIWGTGFMALYSCTKALCSLYDACWITTSHKVLPSPRKVPLPSRRAFIYLWVYIELVTWKSEKLP